MSRILSALRTSEIRRQQGGVPGNQPVLPSKISGPKGRTTAYISVLMSSIMILAGSGVYLHLADGAPSPTSSAPASPTQPLAVAIERNNRSAEHTTELGSLNVDVLVYSDNPAARFVLINMRRFGEGDVIVPGTYILEISATEVIINHRGSRLRLTPHAHRVNEGNGS